MVRSALMVGLVIATGTLAQGVPPDYGHDFVTIGNPGNRPATELEAPRWETEFLGPLGTVDYTYRITRTEVTNAQYHRFITKYVQTRGLPFSPGAGLGRGLHITGFDPGGVPIIEIGEGRENTPVEVSILFAAAYANWLHNDQGTSREDFATGAYDLAQFIPDPDTGLYPPQKGREAGARFSLPSLDEWTKAAHYDPNRYGEGQEGYWLYPDGGNDPLVTGFPGDPGAETSAGTEVYDLFDVGSYPDTMSPWGLLDVSGGMNEATDTLTYFRDQRHGVGSSVITQPWDEIDRLDLSDSIDNGDPIGFRIVSVVPAPGSVMVMLAGALFLLPRRR